MFWRTPMRRQASKRSRDGSASLAPVYGPEILARYLSVPNPEPDLYGLHWQYHSQSDRHGKVGCWGVAFDLLLHSPVMRQHAIDGKITIGVNHQMVDYSTGRKKDLDLVIAKPSGQSPKKARTFQSLAVDYGLPLTSAELGDLTALPVIEVAPVGAVLIALEAKACMTAHVKSMPRFYDELNSSHLTIHGASNNALAIAYVQVNGATEFISSKQSALMSHGVEPTISKHDQPRVTQVVLDKVDQLPRRTGSHGVGFDAIGISVFDLANDGTTPVTVVSSAPAPKPGDNFHYDGMIVRMANEYDATFAHI